MATITRRGAFQFQAIVRRKGFPSQTKTFETKAEAVAWARDIESQIDKRQFRDRRELETTTLSVLLLRYLDKITPDKKGHVSERNRIRLPLRHPLAKRPLSSLDARDFAAYRDERLRTVSNNTVRLELALLSHVYTIAIKEWSMPLDRVIGDIRKPKAGEARDRRLHRDEEARMRTALYRPTQRGTSIWLEACIDLAIETATGGATQASVCAS